MTSVKARSPGIDPFLGIVRKMFWELSYKVCAGSTVKILRSFRVQIPKLNRAKGIVRRYQVNLVSTLAVILKFLGSPGQVILRMGASIK